MADLTMEECVGTGSPGRLIRHVNKLMLTGISWRFAQGDLSFSQWLALKLIQDGVVSNAGELSREINMTSGAMTRLIDSLETRGLLRRNRALDDRRVVNVELTDAGRERTAESAPMIQSAWNELLQDFSRNEVHELVRLLAKLLTALEQTVPPEADFDDPTFGAARKALP